MNIIYKVKRNVRVMMMLWIFIFIFHISIISPVLNAEDEKSDKLQYLHFKQILFEENLSQSGVTCILQDKKGFMWFGTQEGLNRFDGYEMKVFKHDPNDKKSLSDNYILCMYEDKGGNLWIGTNGGGLNKFNPQTGVFDIYTNEEKGKEKEKNSLSDNAVQTIVQDDTDMIWVGTRSGGVDKFSPQTNHFENYNQQLNIQNGDKEKNIHVIYKDKSGKLWIGTGCDLIYFDPIHPTQIKSYQKSWNQHDVRAIFEDKLGNTWVGTYNDGLFKFDQGRFPQYKYEESEKQNEPKKVYNINAIFEDRLGDLWVGTEGGLFRFNSGKIDTNSYNFVPFSSGNYDVRSICQDRGGVLWVGTYGGGVFKHDPRTRLFKHYKQDPSDPNSLSDNLIWGIYEDKNKMLWVGTYRGGLNKIDRQNGLVIQYKFPDLPDNNVRAIEEGEEGILWIGTVKRLGRLENGKFDHYSITSDKDPQKKARDNIIIIKKSRDKKLWIGTQGGLYKFDPSSNKTVEFIDKGNKTSCLEINNIRALYVDEKILWIGAENGGLDRFNTTNGEREHYIHDPDDAESISHNSINCIYKDKSKVLWVGTYGGGLNKLREEGGKILFTSYREKDASSNIYGILEDDKGNLWLSTNSGISRFDPRTGEFKKNYDMEDGLQSNEFNTGSFFKSKTGEMFFGGIDGLTAFFPGDIKDDEYIPPIVITEFLLANKPDALNPESPQEKPIDVTNSITLSPNQNFFSIEFAGLYYANPGKNRYRYKLQGFENTWIEANAKNRRATYTNLPAGDYKFVVSASNRDGKWSQVDASITISIKLPSEKATWAYLIYSLLAFVFIGLFWSILKDRKISQHNRQLLVITRDLEKKVEERTAQLIHTEKMSGLGRLVSSVAHEINNPTAIMITAAYNLKKRLDQFKAFLDKSVEADDDPEIIKTFDRRFAELHDSLKSFNDGAQRIYRIVTDLRTFYRKDSGEKKHFHPNQGLQATLALVEPKYRDTIEFKTDFQEDAIIDGYPDELNQVFMNLITNSCQAIIARQKEANPATSPKTGILTVCTQIKAEYLLIGFQDNGIGMTKEVREKMFEPFFTDKPVGEGTGIGLSISYEIIKKHDGKIEVDYSEPGKGTTIHVFLPLPENEKEKMETKKEAI